MSYGDGVEVFDAKLSIVEGLMDDGLDGFDVGAGGDLGNDATVSGMDVDLGNYYIREDVIAVFDDSGGGFVARTFDTKDAHSVYIIA